MEGVTKSRLIDRIALVLFLWSAAVLLFGYGVFVGRYHVFPYRWLADAAKTSREIISTRQFTPHHLSPARYDFSGVRIHDKNSISPGVTLLTGYWRNFDWKAGIRLIDSKGSVLHQWKTDPAEIWRTSPHVDHVRGTKNISENYIHGCYLFNNGDVIFSIEHLGLVRMNSHGNVLWKLPYRTHHSVTRDEYGHFWVCGTKWLEDTPEGLERLALYPGLKLPVAEDFALLVTEHGEIIREISILKALFHSGHQKLIWQTGAPRSGDILHTNDVEPLFSAMADQYPMFNSNDIIVSTRYLNMVFVIDVETERIKWLSGGFLQQHDPDFVGNGHISVFDNNNDGSSEGDYLGGSRILMLKVGSDEISVLYPKIGTQRFYTEMGGKIQRLKNGNLLITEARPGRVFEVDETGRTVWEWVSERYDSKLVPEILEGTRYALTAEQISRWN